MVLQPWKDFEGNIKLCDFGLASTRNTTAGTPMYMAPELLQNKPFNRAVDVYAYGVLLSEIFTREVPFDGYSPYEIRDRVIAGARPKVPSVMTGKERFCFLLFIVYTA